MSRTALQMRKASGDGPVEVMQRLVLDEAPGKIQPGAPTPPPNRGPLPFCAVCAMEGHSELLGQSLRLFLRHCDPKKCEHSVRKAGEMLEALRSDFGLAATDTPTVWSTGTDTAGTAGTLLPGQQEAWTLKLLGLQGETKVLRNLPCQITFGNLHEKIREVTGAKDQGCDVKLMLNGTVLQHSRATVLSDMSRCNGMELTYLMQPIVPHLGRMLAPRQSLPRKSRIDPEALMRAYETSYNQQRRSVQWAVEAARAREERLTQLISQSPEGSTWNLSCLGSRPPLPGEKANFKCRLGGS